MAQIQDHIIDRIRDAVDIVELISRYITLKKHGKNYKALCPFHTEKTPSFTVSPDKQIFYCFGCGAGGNVFNFLMRYEKISFPEVLQKLADETGISLPRHGTDKKESSEYDRHYRANQFAADFFYNNLQQQQTSLKDYLHSRQIGDTTIKEFRLGYAPDSWDALLTAISVKKLKLDSFLKTGLILQSEKESKKKYDRFRNRLIFPIHNLSGRIVAFGGRTLSSDSNSPKYLNSPESPIYIKSQILYGLYFSKDWIRQEDYAVFVEGYMDYLQLFQNNIKNVVATSGTALTADHAKVISRFTKNIILCYDADTAGIQAALRGGQILFQENLNVKVILLPENEDPDSFLIKQGSSAFYVLLKEAKEYFDFKTEQLIKSIGTGTVAQKSAVTEELINSLVPHIDPLKFNFYARIIAQKFQIPEETVMQEIQKRKKTTYLREKKYSEGKSAQTRDVSSPLPLTGAWAAERDILVLILKHFKEVQELVFQFLEPDEFLNPVFMNAFTLLKKVDQQQVKDISHWLFSAIEDESVVSLLSGEMLKEIRQPMPYLKDCIEKVKIAALQKQVAETQQQLSKIDPDSPDHRVLLKQLNAHLLKIREIKNIFSKKNEQDSDSKY